MTAAAFGYFAPSTVREALALLAEHEQARPLAGGQSLVPMMIARLARPAVLVDLNRIPELTHITEADGELRIGSMVRQARLLASSHVAELVPLLSETLENVGHPPTRNRGTIGGSLANADPAAELPAAMLALDAVMVLHGLRGERTVPAADFFLGMFETALAEGELLTEIRIPSGVRGGSSFLEITRRKGDFAIVSVAARLWNDRGRPDARVVVGGIAPAPLRLSAVEEIVTGRGAGDSAIAEAVAAIPGDIVEFESHGAGRHYRGKVLRVLVRRALEAARARSETSP